MCPEARNEVVLNCLALLAFFLHFELLDSICIQAGSEYYWSATDAVVVYKKTNEPESSPIDPFDNKRPNLPE